MKNQKKSTWYKMVYAAIIILGMLTLLTGCVGLVAGSMAKSMSTTKSYADMEYFLPELAEDQGRIFVYRTRSSTGVSLEFNLGLVKNPTYFTIGDDAYEIIWEAFRYFDLSSGQHQITSGRDVLVKTDAWRGEKGVFKRGTNALQVTLEPGSSIYLRLDLTEDGKSFRPTLVDYQTAISEIGPLPHQHKRYQVYDGKVTVE